MQVQINPNVILSDDCSIAINIIDSEIHYIQTNYRDRLREIRNEISDIQSIDISLIKIGILRLEEQAEFEKKVLKEAIHKYLTQSGALCIMPTELCNFRCTYCYETFEKGRMPKSIIEGIIVFLKTNAPCFQNYSLGWFGGEPLLHPDIIVQVGKVFRQLQYEHGFGGSIAITTNGSLLNFKTLECLKPISIDMYHISMDGPRDLHNRQRIGISGTDTYDIILDNIERVLETTQSRIIFRVNLNTESPQLGAIVEQWLSEEIMPRYEKFGERIRYKVVSIWNASTTSIEGICISDSQKFQTWFDVQQHLAKATARGVTTAMLREIAGLGTLACYAGKPNHYVIGSDGTVYKCTVAFALPENKVGFINSNGEMTLDKNRENLWINSNSLTDPSCSNCSFGVSCMGLHCPLTRLQTDSPPCPTEKKFISSYLSAAQQ
jgi:uncharacterized protein